MATNIIKMAKERIKEARKQLDELKTLLTLMKEAGEDVTELEIQKDDLEERITRWEEALKRFE